MFRGLRNLFAQKAASAPQAPVPPVIPAAPCLSTPEGIKAARLATAFELSEAFEAFRAHPYLDSAGVWTIGVGSTRDLWGSPVTRSTPPVTRQQAAHMHSRDLQVAVDRLNADGLGWLPERWWITCVLLNNNLGTMSAWGPTLLRLLQSQRWEDAAHQLKAYRNAGGKPVLGLRRRRWTEAAYTAGVPFERAKELAWTQINSVDDWPSFPTGA